MTPTHKPIRDPRERHSAGSFTALAMRLPGAVSIIMLGALAAGCSQGASALRPQGPGAQMIADLWWFMLALAVLVFVAVTAFLFIALTQHRRAGPPSDPERTGRHLIMWGGVVVPTVILLSIMLATVLVLRTHAQTQRVADVNIEVVGKQWWWEVRYPDHGFTTANEIHIPVGQTVR
jgi:cytochrome c oxidase subunit II